MSSTCSIIFYIITPVILALFASFFIDIRSRQCYFRVCQSGEIWNKKAFLSVYWFMVSVHSFSYGCNWEDSKHLRSGVALSYCLVQVLHFPRVYQPPGCTHNSMDACYPWANNIVLNGNVARLLIWYINCICQTHPFHNTTPITTQLCCKNSLVMQKQFLNV